MFKDTVWFFNHNTSYNGVKNNYVSYPTSTEKCFGIIPPAHTHFVRNTNITFRIHNMPLENNLTLNH